MPILWFRYLDTGDRSLIWFIVPLFSHLENTSFFVTDEKSLMYCMHVSLNWLFYIYMLMYIDRDRNICLISVSHKEWNIWLLELVWWPDLVIAIILVVLEKSRFVILYIYYDTIPFLVSRYPLGRVIGGTVYPGLTLTAGTLWWYVFRINVMFEKFFMPVFLKKFKNYNSQCPQSTYYFEPI